MTFDLYYIYKLAPYYHLAPWTFECGGTFIILLYCSDLLSIHICSIMAHKIRVLWSIFQNNHERYWMLLWLCHYGLFPNFYEFYENGRGAQYDLCWGLISNVSELLDLSQVLFKGNFVGGLADRDKGSNVFLFVYSLTLVTTYIFKRIIQNVLWTIYEIPYSQR